jgi:hypothetical protein
MRYTVEEAASGTHKRSIADRILKETFLIAAIAYSRIGARRQ